MTNSRLIAAIVVLMVFLYVYVWQWTICRVYVPPGGMLVLTRRIGSANTDPDARVVDAGVQGVQKEVLTEGRHFVNPFFYDVTRANAVTIGPDEIGIVRSLTGVQPGKDEFLVVPAADIFAKKGIWRDVLTPGTWRFNPAAFEVEKGKAKRIAPGFAGCVTSLSGQPAKPGQLAGKDERGIQSKVLQPGLYYMNPRAVNIEEVEIGFRELSLNDVSFPSKDGFPIQLDVTVVWGILPEHLPHVMMHFGGVKEVSDKILKPQVESICRIEGSRYGAKELIEGETREAFQHAFTLALTKVCESKKITVRLGLVRSIDVPLEIRQPIQQSRIAMEEKKTKEQQQITQARINQLSELEADVDKGVREVAAETEKMIARVRAEGEKKIAEMQAERMVKVAEKEKEIALLAAKRSTLLGRAEATVNQLANEAEADRLKQNVEAIGGAEAYANFQFASNLPADFKVFIRYAGPGTFWTDLPAGAKSLHDAADAKILENAK